MSDYRIEQFENALTQAAGIPKPPSPDVPDQVKILADRWLRQVEYHGNALAALIGCVSVTASKVTLSDSGARALEVLYKELDSALRKAGLR